mmetsp:Transcript_1757/g.3487  ORF Transcript_1757/g.3487 Transcript_1757/m.3487 type:complete len:99 (+) Transcript_1757:457-753(+)
MSDSEQITPPQLGCCQQEASWPVSCTYLPLHFLSRVHAQELPLHFAGSEDKIMLFFVVFFFVFVFFTARPASSSSLSFGGEWLVRYFDNNNKKKNQHC